ncbi:hypothetical protein NKG05_14185 [Oerskovia sp. M15]
MPRKDDIAQAALADQDRARRERDARKHLLDLGADELDARPWQPAPVPPSAVDLARFALWRSADLAQDDLLSALALLPAARAEVDGLEDGLLFTARSAGLTWAQIADATGFNSPQACQQHYNRLAARQGAARDAGLPVRPARAARRPHHRLRRYPVLAHRFGLDPAETSEELGDAEARGWCSTPPSPASGLVPDRGGSHRERAPAGGRARSRRRRGRDPRDLPGVPPAEFPSAAGLHRLAASAHPTIVSPSTTTQIPAGTPVSSTSSAPSTARSPARAPPRGRPRPPRRIRRALHRGAPTRPGREGGWVDRTDVDSCHRVWFELHEDLVATLGIDRGTEL